MSPKGQELSDSAEQLTEPPLPPRHYAPAAPTWGKRLAWIAFAVFLLTVNFLWVWTCSSRASRRLQRQMKAEAHQMIAAIREAEEAHLREASGYLSSSERDEDDFYPPPLAEPTPQSFTPKRDHQRRWGALGVKPPSDKLYCGYVVISGPAGNLTAAGRRGRALLGAPAPDRPWYYIRAHCSVGGGTRLLFETTSLSKKIVEEKN
ncbi:MAG: hypothetical protein ABI333_14765 [bacterium]